MHIELTIKTDSAAEIAEVTQALAGRPGKAASESASVSSAPAGLPKPTQVKLRQRWRCEDIDGDLYVKSHPVWGVPTAMGGDEVGLSHSMGAGPSEVWISARTMLSSPRWAFLGPASAPEKPPKRDVEAMLAMERDGALTQVVALSGQLDVALKTRDEARADATALRERLDGETRRAHADGVVEGLRRASAIVRGRGDAGSFELDLLNAFDRAATADPPGGFAPADRQPNADRAALLALAEGWDDMAASLGRDARADDVCAGKAFGLRAAAADLRRLLDAPRGPGGGERGAVEAKPAEALQAELDQARRDLAFERAEADRLRKRVGELEEEISKARAEIDTDNRLLEHRIPLSASAPAKTVDRVVREGLDVARVADGASPWRGIVHEARQGRLVWETWHVECDRYSAKFNGPHAEQRAREYAAWVSAPRQASPPIPRLHPVTPGPVQALAERIADLLTEVYSQPADGELRAMPTAIRVLQLVDEFLRGEQPAAAPKANGAVPADTLTGLDAGGGP